MSRQRGERILGPYAQHNGWRVVEVDAAGGRSATVFPTEEDARRAIESASAHPIARKAGTGKIVRKDHRSGDHRFQVYGRAKGKQVYIGTFDSESEAQAALDQHNTNAQSPTGPIASIRVVATYENGVERSLHQFPVSEPGILGFESEDDDYLVIITQVPREKHSTTEPDPLDVWKFNPETDIERELPF